MRLVALVLLILGLASPALADPTWITASEKPVQPFVLHFRRDITLSTMPKHLWLRVSADNRFNLYVNGQHAGTGPATSDLTHWRCERIDIAPYLKKGRNAVAAEVWDFVIPGTDDLDTQVGAMAQQTAGAGLYVAAEDKVFSGLDTGSDWQVDVDPDHGAVSGVHQMDRPDWIGYYVAGAPETINGPGADTAWRTEAVDWPASVKGADHVLNADPLPAMTYAKVDSGKVVRGDALPATIPAHSHVQILIQRPDMISAYPQLRVSGGAGAAIKVTYTEAPYVSGNKRGVRDDPTGEIKGVTDAFTTDGPARTFAPLWWRTWRFVQIDVTTGDSPLKVEGFDAYQTGYPFETRGAFQSDDPELDAIWQIGWRTARLDAHDTYMDSAYWEQLQYVGDTRIQMLMSYAVAGDDRLAVNALDAFGWSDSEGGLTEGAYPSRGHNVIAPFSLLWIGALHDYWMHERDGAVIARNLPRARQVLAWFRPYLHDDGLLGKNPTWNFVDWVGKDRDAFPSFDKDGESCLTTLGYLGALEQMADIDPVKAADDRLLAAKVKAGLRAKCWDSDRGLYADDAAKTLYSQHSNVLAVLYDVATPDEAPGILKRITTGHGIDAPDGIIPVSYYFSWYLVRAFEHAGMGDDYMSLLGTWRDLLPLHFSTWPEAKLETRSDTHAWSGHPTADLLAIVAGIEPDAPGYASVKIEPNLGNLKKLHAVAMTPSGAVTVDYAVSGGRLTATVHKPSDLPGRFVWHGKSLPLKAKVTQLTL